MGFRVDIKKEEEIKSVCVMSGILGISYQMTSGAGKAFIFGVIL